MKYDYRSAHNNGLIAMMFDQAQFERNNYESKITFTTYIIAWNRGSTIQIKIDEVLYNFPANSVLPIMHDQCFEIEFAEQIVFWEFNSDFYCIVNHDAEVGCVGYIFYGPQPTMFIDLTEEDVDSLNRMLLVFEEEFTSIEDIKQEMLRMLLIRLIIKITRIAKKQYLSTEVVEEDKFNLIRKFHLLVELHFKKEHQINFYANLLHKSPKTISNYFALYSKKTPLQVIHERIIAEAKRLVYYTDKSIKEIADELGFEEVAHFSKFFKNVTAKSPSEFRNNQTSKI
jgi:AraC family transcriptional activator of pobA